MLVQREKRNLCYKGIIFQTFYENFLKNVVYYSKLYSTQGFIVSDYYYK